jgi:predicted RecB family nuclease
MILKFADFWTTHKPELIVTEYHLFSDNHEYAGTADLVVKINDKVWLLDIKTSNSLHTSYGLQLAAYAMAWNETHICSGSSTSGRWGGTN